jgi:hypothetical protein
VDVPPKYQKPETPSKGTKEQTMDLSKGAVKVPAKKPAIATSKASGKETAKKSIKKLQQNLGL